MIFKLFKSHSFVLLFLLFSCVVYEPVAYTGSKADGIVTVSYQYPGGMQPSEQNWIEADREATQRCANWGYSGAEKFRRSTRVCAVFGYFGCTQWKEYLNYQCVD